MTVTLKNLKSGKLIKEKFVTDININNERIELHFDRRIRSTMVKTTISMRDYVVESIDR